MFHFYLWKYDWYVLQNAELGGVPHFEHDENLFLEKREQMFYNVEDRNRVESKYPVRDRSKLLRPDFHHETSKYQSELMFRRDEDYVMKAWSPVIIVTTLDISIIAPCFCYSSTVMSCHMLSKTFFIANSCIQCCVFIILHFGYLFQPNFVTNYILTRAFNKLEKGISFILNSHIQVSFTSN